MTMSSPTIVETAQLAGYHVVTEANIAVDPAAARMVPVGYTDNCLGVALAAGVLAVVTDLPPSPALHAQLEAATGVAITLACAPSDVLAELSKRAPRTDQTSRLIDVTAEAHAAGATEVILTPGAAARLRTYSGLQPSQALPNVTPGDIEAARAWFGARAGRTVVVPTRHGRWRARSAGETIVLRATPEAPAQPTLPPALTSASENPGLVIVASAHGGGRTTTADALVTHLANTQPKLIARVEDAPRRRPNAPVGMVVSLPAQSPGARAEQIKHAAQLGADVIVAELDDEATTRAAIQAALAGVTVIATVPAARATHALEQLQARFAADERHWVRTTLAAVATIVTAQTLVVSGDATRTAVFEVAALTPALAELVRSDEIARISQVLHAAPSPTSMPMERALAAQVTAGAISVADAKRSAGENTEMAALMTATPTPQRPHNGDAATPATPAPPHGQPARRATRRAAVDERETLTR